VQRLGARLSIVPGEPGEDREHRLEPGLTVFYVGLDPVEDLLLGAWQTHDAPLPANDPRKRCVTVSQVTFPGRHFNVLLHLAVPLVGALALVPVLLAAFGIDFAHLSITGLTWPANLAPLICLAWMVLGLGLLGYFMIRDRSRIIETRRVFTEQTPAERESATHK
jgi:hypothetical protein